MRIAHDSARVRVPATSANLGPGFDAFGLALDLTDSVEVRATTGATTTRVSGEGAGTLPDGEDHLIVRALRCGLDAVGASQVGLDLRARNAIPHGRGLGSSAAAVVAGLMLARGLIAEPDALDDERVLALATELEGHPDNAAAALLGGATIAWDPQALGLGDHEPPAPDPVAGVAATRIEVSPSLTCTVLVPAVELATRLARSVLPEAVPHADAAFSAGRAGLLTLALAGREDLMFAATADRLHQHYRRDVMASSLDLVGWLRARRLPAVISGAGPSVLVLGGLERSMLDRLAAQGWTTHVLRVDLDGARLL